MDIIEQENQGLHEDVENLKLGMERIIVLLETLVATQNQPPPPPSPQKQSYQQQHNHVQRKNQFNPIPMKYVELLPALLQKGLVQTRFLPAIPKDIPWWYKAYACCAFHQGAPGHDTENCFPLKTKVQKLMKSGVLSFQGVPPRIILNLL